MGSPISPMEAIQIVQKVVALYQKVRHDVPEQVQKVGKRMQRLEMYLISLKELIDDEKRHVLATMRPGETTELRSIIKEIQEDSQKVYDILNDWDNNIGPFGLQMRFSTVAQALFSVGSSPDKLESLGQDIEQHKQDLRDFLQLMGYFGMNQLLPPNPQHQIIRNPSPAPAAQVSGKLYNIVFVDPSNLGRSVVAEAYMKLLREWTVRSGGNWPIHSAHSAGIRVRSKSDATEILQGMKPPIDIVAGNSLPLQTAMDSLFDNSRFNHPYKNDIKNDVAKHRSRGINKSVFKHYDFILVFVAREYESLLLFKQTLGKSFAPRGSARIVHLGAHLATMAHGKPKGIWDAAKAKDGSQDRGNWNKTTAEIKVAIKKFLGKETGWKQPGLSNQQAPTKS